jgi:hypothetical protein
MCFMPRKIKKLCQLRFLGFSHDSFPHSVVWLNKVHLFSIQLLLPPNARKANVDNYYLE